MNDTTTKNQDAAERWAGRLAELAAKHGVPGAQLGILRLGADGAADEVVAATHGYLHVPTQTPVTEGTVFQYGSISKVWTATVIMRLVEEGRFTLDTPVHEIIPGVRLANDHLTDGITIRHLLDRNPQPEPAARIRGDAR